MDFSPSGFYLRFTFWERVRDGPTPVQNNTGKDFQISFDLVGVSAEIPRAEGAMQLKIFYNHAAYLHHHIAAFRDRLLTLFMDIGSEKLHSRGQSEAR